MSKRHLPEPTFAELQEQLQTLYATAKTRTSFRAGAERAAKNIIANRARYEEADGLTSVPWWWTGIAHQMEGGANFHTHLHNGDSLAHRTVQEPKGRPLTGHPVFTWIESACDALTMPQHGLCGIARKDWTPVQASYRWEKWNGWGYRWFHPNTLSAYLWSGTQHYSSGKYVEDRVWSDTAVSEQVGAIAILKAMLEIEPGIFELVEDAAHEDAPPQAPPQAPPLPGPKETTASSFPRATEAGPSLLDKLKDHWHHVLAILGIGTAAGDAVHPQLPSVDQLVDVGQQTVNLKPTLMGIFPPEAMWFGMACVATYLLLGHVLPWLHGDD